MKRQALTLLACLIVAVLLATPAARADDDAPAAKKSSEYAKGVELIKSGDFRAGIDWLNKALAAAPKDADIQNMLGFAHRKLGELDNAFQHYEKALALDPDHKGAHEYLGEAYLMAGNLAKAKEQLAVLNKLCTFSCEQYRDLKEAIAKYEAGKK